MSVDSKQRTWVSWGIFRMPPLCAALFAAAAVHAVVILAVAVIIGWSPAGTTTPPRPLYTMGRPIQVHLADPPPQPEQSDAAEVDVTADPPPDANEEQPTAARPIVAEHAIVDPLPDSIASRRAPIAVQPDAMPAVTLEAGHTHVVPTRMVDSLLALLANLPETIAVEPAIAVGTIASAAATAPPPEPALAALPEVPTSTDPTSSTSPKRHTPLNAASKSPPTGITRAASVRRVPTPTYPKRSIRAGHEGTAVVEVQVLADGSVGRVMLHQSSGHRALDNAAIAAAKRGRYQPALINGVAGPATIHVPFEFNLRER